MRHVRLAVIALFAVFAAVPVAAETDQLDEGADARLRLDYSVYFGGFNVIELGIEVSVAPQAYDVVTQIETVGLAGVFVPWKSVAKSEGSLTDERVEPRLHRMEGEFRGRPRTAAIDYQNGDVVNVALQPPLADAQRDAVPPELKRGAVDPASALLSVSRLVAQGRGCEGRLPVFDGRRRYDIVVGGHGVETLAANAYNAFQGQAVRCDFSFEPIAGENIPKGPDAEQRKRRFRTGRAWFAELLPGRPLVPVRIEINGDLAQTLVHLREMPRPALAAN